MVLAVAVWHSTQNRSAEAAAAEDLARHSGADIRPAFLREATFAHGSYQSW
jgi:hypothetical protein